jgi:protein-L-isoaspartate O-methyltransferase
VELDQEKFTPPYFRYTIRLLTHFPNFDHSFIGPLRRRAVDMLQLAKGDRALDVGCGPGGSFPYLLAAVGQPGQIVGVEISPEVASTARKRIAANEWTNVEVVTGDAAYRCPEREIQWNSDVWCP